MTTGKTQLHSKTSTSSNNCANNANGHQNSSLFTLPKLSNGPEPSEAMTVNVVKVLEDTDYLYAKNICDEHLGWQLAFEKKATKVWTQTVPNTDLHMIKARSEFPDVSAELCYDVLQDPEYRHKWDKYVLKTSGIGYLNPNNDICYYSLGALPPFRSRDFVMQRSWLDTGAEKYILAHSVWHDKFPPTKAHIRGIIFMTIYFVRCLGPGKGCQVTYVTYSDPRGKLPQWLVNKVTKIIAPRLIKKLHKACLKYSEWKQSHGSSSLKPWLSMDIQADYPRINPSDCVPKIELLELEIVDETQVNENSVNEKEED